MAKFIVDGNRRLQGEVDLQGAKNSALPIISATLLCSGESVIHCCPIISDINASIQILRYLGCSAKLSDHTLIVDSKDMNRCDIPENLMNEMRSSIVFLGADRKSVV